MTSRSNIPELLEISHDRVERCAELYEWYGRSTLEGRGVRIDDSALNRIQRSKPSEAVMLGASGLMISAAYWSMLDQTRAKGLFRIAAREYARMSNPYYIILAICGRDVELVQAAMSSSTERIQQERLGILEPDVLLHDALAMMGAMSLFGTELRTFEHTDRFLQRTQAYAFDPIGRLELPAHLYFDIATEMRLGALNDDPGARRLGRSIAHYLRRVDESISGAMSDRFHWTRLRSNVLPLEPESLASCMTANMLIQNLVPGHTGESVLENELMSSRQMVPFYAAQRMVSSK